MFQNFTLHLKNFHSYIWNNGFDCAVSQEAMKSWFFFVKRFIKCSTSVRGGGISENIHWRFLSWLKCRFQDMSEESVLNILGQYFNGIYLVKAIHSQNSGHSCWILFVPLTLKWQMKNSITHTSVQFSILYDRPIDKTQVLTASVEVLQHKIV